MKNFKVVININSTAILNIDAASPEEAEAVAREIYEAGNICFDNITSIQVKEEN